MRNALRLSLVAGVAISLLACGGGAKIGGGKEGAAAALFAASGSTKTNGSLLDVVGQNLDQSGEFTGNCPFGGKATYKGFQLINDVQNPTNIEQKFTLSYAACGATTFDNPKTTAVEKDVVVVNGDMTLAQKMSFDVSKPSASGNVTQTMKGDLKFGGAFDDSLNADITQTVDWSKLGTQGGTVTVTLNGKIVTSTETYTYNNEVISLTAGLMVAAEPKP
jgi:hypothetical protein